MYRYWVFLLYIISSHIFLCARNSAPIIFAKSLYQKFCHILHNIHRKCVLYFKPVVKVLVTYLIWYHFPVLHQQLHCWIFVDSNLTHLFHDFSSGNRGRVHLWSDLLRPGCQGRHTEFRGNEIDTSAPGYDLWPCCAGVQCHFQPFQNNGVSRHVCNCFKLSKFSLLNGNWMELVSRYDVQIFQSSE